MGKTSKPLTIWVTTEELFDWLEVRALAAQGHSLTVIPGKGMPFDLILGPECGIMEEQHRPFLKHHIDRARARKYPSKSKETPADEVESGD